MSITHLRMECVLLLYFILQLCKAACETIKKRVKGSQKVQFLSHYVKLLWPIKKLGQTKPITNNHLAWKLGKSCLCQVREIVDYRVSAFWHPAYVFLKCLDEFSYDFRRRPLTKPVLSPPKIKWNAYLSDINHGLYKDRVNLSIIEQLDAATEGVFHQQTQDSIYPVKKQTNKKQPSWQSATIWFFSTTQCRMKAWMVISFCYAEKRVLIIPIRKKKNKHQGLALVWQSPSHRFLFQTKHLQTF